YPRALRPAHAVATHQANCMRLNRPMPPTPAIASAYDKKPACVKLLTLALRTMWQSNHHLITLKRVTRDAKDDHFRRSSRHRRDGRRLVDCHVRQVESWRPRACHRDVGAGLAP